MRIRDRLGLTLQDWSLPYWGALATFVIGYGVLRFLGAFLTVVDVPGVWFPGILASIAALPMAPGVAEATYRAQTGRGTRGVPRVFLCLVGPLGFHIPAGIFAGVPLAAALRSSLLVSAFAAVWFLVLDKALSTPQLRIEQRDASRPIFPS